jgi:peroxiredoxin
MSGQRNARLEDLERRFSELAPHLPDTPEKEAISILHAILLESRQQAARIGQSATEQPRDSHASSSGRSLEYVANLYKSAPAMEGQALNEGLPVGSRAPEFSLPDAGGRQVRLPDYRSQTVILAFYPLDWSPACSDQLSLYESEMGGFEKEGARVIGISVDSVYSHGAWAAVRGISFPLLADFHPKGEVARRYNVYRAPDGFSERAVYIVDGEGIIRYCHISPELHMIPDIYELFEQLARLRSEPANEKPG